VDIALVVSALLMGLAGSVHCIAMCGAASAAAVRACGGRQLRSAWLSFHLGRLVGYAAAGAVVASSVSLLARLGAWSPALRPLWTLAHLAALGLGLWLLWKGRQPAWLERLGREGQRIDQVDVTGWQAMRGPVRAAGVGAVWFAWPCGLLQSALTVAALANGPVAGAAVMASFAVASSVALGGLPALWWRWRGQDAAWGGRVTRWAVRLSGLALAGASAWALGHDLWIRVVAYCLS
jgi:sulfite exporter TauE/SafE